MTEEKAQSGGIDVGSPLERMATLFSGSFASGFDVAAASSAMDRKQRRWMEAQGRLDPNAAAALDGRIAVADRRAELLFANLARAAAAPIAEEDAMIVAGRVTEGQQGKPDLIVTAIERKGEPLGCATSGAGGNFRIRLERGEEFVLTVSEGKRKPILVDDRVTAVERGKTAYFELDLAKRGPGECPKGPDLSDRLPMPDLVNKHIDEAKSLAEKSGLRIDKIDIEAQPGKEGIVLRTDPPAGRLLDDTRLIRVVVGNDPSANFNRGTVASILKVETGEAVTDDLVDRLFAKLSEQRVTGFDKLRAASRRDDQSFAELSGLPRRVAAALRGALENVLARIGALRGKDD